MDTTASAAFSSPVTGGPRRLPRVSDELLARASARGSTRAFAAIYERYHQPIYAYVRLIVRHDQDAQDVVQAAFANALAALAQRQPRAPLRPWLYRIAHNEAISLLRRRRRHPTESLDDSTAPVAISAEEEAAQRHRWAQLTADLGELPDRQREALLLRELSGLSHADIAIVLGASVGAAKQAILEARRALAEFGEGRAMDCDTVRQRISDGDRRVLRGRRIGAHLRGCAACAAFAESIDHRRAQLRALSPVLPAGAGATLLAQTLRSGVMHGAGAGSSGPATATGAGLAGKVLATATTWKAVTGTAVFLATASAGVAELHHAIVVRRDQISPIALRHDRTRHARHSAMVVRPDRATPASVSRTAPASVSRTASASVSRTAPASVSRAAPRSVSRSAPRSVSRSASGSVSRSAPAARVDVTPPARVARPVHRPFVVSRRPASRLTPVRRSGPMHGRAVIVPRSSSPATAVTPAPWHVHGSRPRHWDSRGQPNTRPVGPNPRVLRAYTPRRTARSGSSFPSLAHRR